MESEMSRMKPSVREGISLIEVLIVLSIISLLIMLIVPAVQSARETGRRTQCANNMRQYGLAFSAYESQHSKFPSGFTAKIKGPLSGDSEWCFYSYMAELLPHLDAGSVAAQYRRDKMFCAPENAAAIEVALGFATCPSAPAREAAPTNDFVPSLALFTQSARENQIIGPILDKLDKKYSVKYRGGIADYAIPSNVEDGLAHALGFNIEEGDQVGMEGMFPSPVEKASDEVFTKLATVLDSSESIEFSEHTEAADISDGLSHTLMLAESAGRPERWEFGQRTNKDEPLRSAWADPASNLRINGIGTPTGQCLLQCDNEGEMYSFHPGIANFLFADGRVESVGTDADPKVILNWFSARFDEETP
jgi:prepilin-type processing-associated H-X9-DG protein